MGVGLDVLVGVRVKVGVSVPIVPEGDVPVGVARILVVKFVSVEYPDQRFESFSYWTLK